MVSFDPRTKQFFKEIKIAKRAEEYVANLLNGSLSEEGNKDYDIILQNGKTVEVKFDKLSKKTGNVAIEYQAYENKTGIARSGADYYFIIFYYKVCWVGALVLKDVLLDMISNIEYKDSFGGDNKATKMKLVPTEHIKIASEHTFLLLKENHYRLGN